MESRLHEILSNEEKQSDNNEIMMNCLKNMNVQISSNTWEHSTKLPPKLLWQKKEMSLAGA